MPRCRLEKTNGRSWLAGETIFLPQRVLFTATSSSSILLPRSKEMIHSAVRRRASKVRGPRNNRRDPASRLVNPWTMKDFVGVLSTPVECHSVYLFSLSTLTSWTLPKGYNYLAMKSVLFAFNIVPLFFTVILLSRLSRFKIQTDIRIIFDTLCKQTRLAFNPYFWVTI